MSNAVFGSDAPPTTPITLSPSRLHYSFFPFNPCFSLLCFSPINCLLCLSFFTLLMLVEGLRANAVIVSGFKAPQMPACFFFQSTETKPRLQQICQLQVWGQVCVPHFPRPQTCCSFATLCMTQSLEGHFLQVKFKSLHLQWGVMKKNSFLHSLTNERRWCI